MKVEAIIFNNWALFCKKIKKKELKRLAFLLESVKFIIMNNRFTVVFNNDQQYFWSYGFGT